MKNSLFITNTIEINAPASEVWDALVNPQKTKQYMFGCETISDWIQGNELLWQGLHEGNPIIYVKGTISEIRPNEFLAYTATDPHSSIDDVSENYLTITYSLSENNGVTTFTVTQGDYSKVAEGERRYQESYNNGEGWNPLLVQIKELVEKK